MARRSAGRPRRSTRRPRSPRTTPGVDRVIAISGLSALDNFADLPNAGVSFVVLKPWDQRSKAAGTDILTIAERLQKGLSTAPDGRLTIVPPPPIQGIGNAGGLQMQVELLGGSFDFQRLSEFTDKIVKQADSDPQLQHVLTTFSPGAPQVSVTVDRDRTQTLRVSVGDVFSTLSSLSGIDLRQSVQQIRPGISGLCAGRLAVPAAARRSLESLCAQPGQPNGSARRSRASRLRGRAIAYHPLQPLSVVDDHRRAGARRQLGPSLDGNGRDREGQSCRATSPTNGPRCPIRKN